MVHTFFDLAGRVPLGRIATTMIKRDGALVCHQVLKRTWWGGKQRPGWVESRPDLAGEYAFTVRQVPRYKAHRRMEDILHYLDS